MELHSACGGDANCLNCTLRQGQDACLSNTGCVALYELDFDPEDACVITTAPDALSDYALCGQVLGPTQGGVNCFICRGPAFMCS